MEKSDSTLQTKHEKTGVHWISVQRKKKPLHIQMHTRTHIFKGELPLKQLNCYKHMQRHTDTCLTKQNKRQFTPSYMATLQVTQHLAISNNTQGSSFHFQLKFTLFLWCLTAFHWGRKKSANTFRWKNNVETDMLGLESDNY